MCRSFRSAFLVGLLLVVQAAFADQTTVTVTSFPSLSVADGRSTVSVTADVRGTDGRPVPDGTQVYFETTLGSFRDSVVGTINGFARAVLVASSSPGIASIRVSAARPDAVPCTVTYEFVANQALLKAATTYIEVVSPSSLIYSLDNKYVTASGSSKNGAVDTPVSVRYGDVQITAADIQLYQPDYELRARKAEVTIAHEKHRFEELYLRLNTLEGVGTTTYWAIRPTAVAPLGLHGFVFMRQDADGNFSIATREERFGTVEIHHGVISPAKKSAAANVVNFVDLDESGSMIGAKKAIIFPRREIQFQRAEIYVQGAKVMHVPLYDLSLNQQQSGLVTGGILSVNDNQINVNYPQYLSLRPGLTSLLRFQTGQQPGASGDETGLFLNYELNWNRGEGMEGGFAVDGIGRNDWSVAVKQFLRIGDKTTLSADAQFPQADSFLGYISGATQLNGFKIDSDLNASRTFTGIQYGSQSYHLGVEKDPVKLGNTPLSTVFSVTADQQENSLINETQQGVGVTMRTQSKPIDLGEKAVLNSNITFSKLWGMNELAGLGIVGNLTVSRPLFPGAKATIGYSYTEDGFNDALIGRNSFNYAASYSRGRLGLQLSGNRGLDVQNNMFVANASFALSPLWNLTSTYNFENFVGNEFLDYGFGFTYRLGIGPLSKGIGLVWNYRTQRLGFQFVGANGF